VTGRTGLQGGERWYGTGLAMGTGVETGVGSLSWLVGPFRGVRGGVVGGVGVLMLVVTFRGVVW
jgi:hypothetical protein